MFAICSHNDEPIHKDVYQKLLAQCKLTPEILRIIWDLVGPTQGTVTRTNLYKTLALVAWAQQGKQPNNKLFETFNGKGKFYFFIDLHYALHVTVIFKIE